MKDYTTPQLFVHGNVEEITLQNGTGSDPKPYCGNDGIGIGQGQGARTEGGVCVS